MSLDAKIFIDYGINYQRRTTNIVKIKNTLIGGHQPILIQTMLTSHTSDVLACLNEIRALVAVGAQMIRLSVLSGHDLQMMDKLLAMLKNEGITVPLVADVHFASHLAVESCLYFDKVRINPGNYSDRPKNYNQSQTSNLPFLEGYERLKEKYAVLAQQLIKHNRALRIGVNHGSLSGRMMEQYGDSPLGMVQSALESLKIFQELGVKNIVVSLKSSNPYIANQAYRLFAKLDKTGTPLHLGVTEAGNDLIARFKTVVGIAPLLIDGIGDTIRVSLTENSANEIIFAKQLLTEIKKNQLIAVNLAHSYQIENEILESNSNTTINTKPKIFDKLKVELGQIKQNNCALKLNNLTIGEKVYIFANVAIINNFNNIISASKSSTSEAIITNDIKIDVAKLLIEISDGTYTQDDRKFTLTSGDFQIYISATQIIQIEVGLPIFQLRNYYLQRWEKMPIALIINNQFDVNKLELAIELGTMLIEGLIDLILIDEELDYEHLNYLLEVFQATRVKMNKADFISCPSCGRTMFDLQQVTNEIKKQTGHLKAVKIGVLGCIVNGPGEMADADFGYVGASGGTIDLYLGQKRVKKNVPTINAIPELISLIKEQGLWYDNN